MRNNRRTRVETFGVLLLAWSAMALAPFAATAQKPAKSYPEEGKVIGRGTTEHAMAPSHYFTQTYKIQTDKMIYMLDCGKKPVFGRTGGECGGEKKIEVGDTIHFRIEKNSVCIPVKDPLFADEVEQKLRIMSQEIKPDSTTEKPATSQP